MLNEVIQFESYSSIQTISSLAKIKLFSPVNSSAISYRLAPFLKRLEDRKNVEICNIDGKKIHLLIDDHDQHELSICKKFTKIYLI